MQALDGLFSRLFPSDDPTEQFVHVWVGIIVLIIAGYLVAIKRGFGARAI